MHPREDKPSPNIQIQPRPILEEELFFQGLKEEHDGQAQQQELTGAGFAIFESESEGSDEEQPPELSSSPAPSSDGVESETASDSEPQVSDDEQPPQMFSSVAPGIQNDAESAESSSEESEEEEEEPHPMFSSAALPLLVSRAVSQAHKANGSDIEEEAERVEEEDDESPPQIFTSALPNHKPAIQSSASTSSGDAPTIFPDESDSNDDDGEANEHTTGTGTYTSSASRSGSGTDDRDSDPSMAGAAQDDFFANLEASARKVKAFRQRQEQEMELQMKLWRADVGPKLARDGMAEGRGSRRGKKKKGVFEVSSSSGEEEGL